MLQPLRRQEPVWLLLTPSPSGQQVYRRGMRGRRARQVTTGALVAALLLGCGDDDAAEDGDAPEREAPAGAAEAGTFAGVLADGSRLVIRLDVPADDPAVAPFEAFRATTGAPEPTWLVGEISVPDDVEGTGRFVTFLEPGADRLDDDLADRTDGVSNADFACAVIEDWFQFAEVKDQALSDAYLEVYDGPCGGQAHQVLAPGGETTTYVMVYEGELPPFESIEAELGNELAPA